MKYRYISQIIIACDERDGWELILILVQVWDKSIFKRKIYTIVHYNNLWASQRKIMRGRLILTYHFF